MVEQAKAIVIDNGSGVFKAGKSGNNSPNYSFPCMIARPQHMDFRSGVVGEKDYYVGEIINSLLHSHLKLEYPIERGMIFNMEDMEKIWDYCLKYMDPEEHPILLTEGPVTPKSNKERMAQIMFEVHQTPSIYISRASVLSLYASGKTTGVVVDAGYGMSSTVPVFEGCALPRAIKTMDLGGKELTEFMKNLMHGQGYNCTSLMEIERIQNFKEEECCVALDFDAEVKHLIKNDSEYKLPDGSSISSKEQRFICPEALFQPSQIQKFFPGIHELAMQSIAECDVELKKDLFQNIVLTGGSSMFPGFSERLNKELTSLAPSSYKVDIIAENDRKNLNWLGGSVLSSLSTFQDISITKEEYQENGASFVHKKCF